MWWWVPAIREAEAGESLEPRRQRLQLAEIAPLHFSLGGQQEQNCLKTENKKQTKKPIMNEKTKNLILSLLPNV